MWHTLSGGTDDHDIGADHFPRRDPDRNAAAPSPRHRRAIAALNKLGYTVTLNPIEPIQTAA